MCGRATLTMVASSTTISCALARTSRARPRRGPPAATPPGAAARVVVDPVSAVPATFMRASWFIGQSCFTKLS